jgi:Tfp pilus assembly protein PilP
MSRRAGGIASGFILLAVAGCGSPAAAPVPQPPSTTVAALPPAPVAPAPAPAPPAEREIPTYETRGRRDPFETLEVREGASGPLVAAAKLTGIVRGEQGPLALVETGDGLGYILKLGDTLGDGRLIEVSRDSVVFSVKTKPGATTNRVVLRLPGD